MSETPNNISEEKEKEVKEVKTEQETEMNDDTKVAKDETLDLQSLMSNVKTEEEPKPEQPPTNVAKANDSAPKEAMSPLDQAIKNESEKVKGIISNTDDIEPDDEQQVLRNTFESDGRNKDYEEKLDELSDLAWKAKHVVVIRKPTNPGEDALMMDEISNIVIDEFGNVTIPEGATYIKAKPTKAQNSSDDSTKKEENDDDEGTGIEEEVSMEDVKHYEERRKVINIIMDKTGLGRDVIFTKDEQKEITEAQEIHITEVENLELESLDVEYDDTGDDFDEGFMQDIESYQISISKTPMVFPCSGFKAEMTGMCWGELGDVALDYSDESEDMMDFDKVYKKCVVIYNHMKQVSCGEFKDFDDFLKKFAYVDLPLATYGLLISTQPEVDTIGLVCQKESCKTRFNQKYNTRSLIDFDTAGDKYLDMIKKISSATTAQDYVNIASGSDVRMVKKLLLPNSKFVVEIGPISMYDYLYKVLKVLKYYNNKREEAEANGEEFDESESALSFLLQVVRAINIPKKNGKHKRVTNGIKMLNILNKYTAAADMEILSAIYSSCQSQYTIEFSVKKAVCPNCGTVTEKVPVEPDELVFYARQRLVTTNIIVDNFPAR